MGELKKWTCAICGDVLVEGQRFGFIPGKGYVHLECLYEKIAPKDRDVVSLMDANEVLTYAIVRLKEATRIAGSEEVKEALVEARKKVEALAAKLELELAKRTDMA